MPYTTGAIYNPPVGLNHVDRIQVSCLNDSILASINLNLQIFHFIGAGFSRTPVGQSLFQVNPQQLIVQTYSVSAANYYEVQLNFYSAVNTVVNVFSLDAAGNLLDQLLQPEFTYIDRLSLITNL